MRLVAAVLAASTVIAAEPVMDPAAARGKLIFESKCTACHAVGQGGKAGPDLAGVTRHMNDAWLARWLRSQLGYAAREAEHLLASPRDRLSRAERIRLMGWPAPLLVFFYVLFAKGAVFDGWAGWYYACQRLLAELLLALELLDRRLSASIR